MAAFRKDSAVTPVEEFERKVEAAQKTPRKPPAPRGPPAAPRGPPAAPRGPARVVVRPQKKPRDESWMKEQARGLGELLDTLVEEEEMEEEVPEEAEAPKAPVDFSSLVAELSSSDPEETPEEQELDEETEEETLKTRGQKLPTSRPKTSPPAPEPPKQPNPSMTFLKPPPQTRKRMFPHENEVATPKRVEIPEPKLVKLADNTGTSLLPAMCLFLCMGCHGDLKNRVVYELPGGKQSVSIQLCKNCVELNGKMGRVHGYAFRQMKK